MDAIEIAGSVGQQILALHKAVSHPCLGVVAKLAGFNPDATLLERQRQNVIEIIQDARNKKGRASNERTQFLDSLLVAVSTYPAETRKYSFRQQAKLLGLKKTVVFNNSKRHQINEKKL